MVIGICWVNRLWMLVIHITIVARCTVVKRGRRTWRVCGIGWGWWGLMLSWKIFGEIIFICKPTARRLLLMLLPLAVAMETLTPIVAVRLRIGITQNLKPLIIVSELTRSRINPIPMFPDSQLLLKPSH